MNKLFRNNNSVNDLVTLLDNHVEVAQKAAESVLLLHLRSNPFQRGGVGLGKLTNKLPDMEMVEAVASSQQNGKKVLNLLTEDDAIAYVSLKCILFLAIHDFLANASVEARP